MVDRHLMAGLRATEALRLHLEASSVALVCFQGDVPDELGSGTLIRVQDRVFVATAAHVIRCRSVDSIEIVGSGALTPSIVGSGCRGGRQSDALDVGWLELEGVSPQRAIPIDRVVCDAQVFEEDVVLVAGSPSELLPRDRLAQRELAIRGVYYLTHTLTAKECGGSLPSHDMLLDYPDRGMYLADGSDYGTPPHPGGMSGGGVWRCHLNPARSVWIPEHATLVGIQISWNEGDRRLRAQLIEHWVRMLADDVSALAPHLERLLSRRP